MRSHSDVAAGRFAHSRSTVRYPRSDQTKRYAPLDFVRSSTQQWPSAIVAYACLGATSATYRPLRPEEPGSCTEDGTIRIFDAASHSQRAEFQAPRAYEGLDITDLTSPADAALATMRALGAVVRTGSALGNPPEPGEST